MKRIPATYRIYVYAHIAIQIHPKISFLWCVKIARNQVFLILEWNLNWKKKNRKKTITYWWFFYISYRCCNIIECENNSPVYIKDFPPYTLVHEKFSTKIHWIWTLCSDLPDKHLDCYSSIFPLLYHYEYIYTPYAGI